MKFSDTPGHNRLKADLRHLADSGQMPHALMISGPSGVGKMNIARAFMQYVHCTERNNGEPCGHCLSCRRHESFNHPDVYFSYPVLKTSKIKNPVSADYIDQWRKMLTEYPLMQPKIWADMIEAENKQPTIYVSESDAIIHSEAFASSSEYKFILLWLPEKMNSETANKLLKIVEEPSEGTVFLMVSNDEGSVLPTIFSRLRRFHAMPLEEEDVAHYLIEKASLPEDAAHQAARLAGGSLSKAIEFGSLSEENEEFAKDFINIMRMCYAKRPADLRDIADLLASYGREKLSRFLNYSARMVRENFIYNLRMPQLTAMTAAEETFSRKFSPFVNHANVEDIITEIDRARSDIERNANARLVLFDLFLWLIPLLHRKAA